MLQIDPQLTAGDVLAIFRYDAAYLFLGSAFITTGIVAIALYALRRRSDALLMWLGVFAGLYGVRLWLQSGMLRLGPHSVFFHRLPSVIDYLIPIPAFAFFRVAGFMGENPRLFRLTAWIRVVFVGLAVGALLFGSLPIFEAINASIVSLFLWILLVRSIRNRKGDRDFKIVRAGALCFLILALWDNIVGQWRPSRIEPYGFAVLLGTLGYVTARRTLKRDLELGEIQKELDLAQRIQHSILPESFPASPHFTVAARYVPMSSVAGDLYDFLAVDADHATLFIADVSGHGVPAALIASMVKMAATSQSIHAAHPAQLLAGMNAALCGNTQGQYVTAACVHLDANTKVLRYAAAGHPAMLLLRDGAVSEIVENGLLLAASNAASYTELGLPLAPRDRLLLYTDGLVEARNSEGKLFGEDALMALFLDTANLPPSNAADRLIAAAQQWAHLQDDDLTVLVCDYLSAH